MENRISVRLTKTMFNTKDKQLKNFGFLFAGMLAIVFGFILPYFFNYSRPNWPFYIAGLLIMLSLLAPQFLVFIKTPWMKIAEILGKVNGFIILGVVFYGMITPYAIILRVFKRRPLKIKYDKTKDSYWSKAVVRDNSHMDTPY